MEQSAYINQPAHRQQGFGEEISNAISHGVGAILAIVATILMLLRAVQSGSGLAIISAALYGGSMILLYLSSCMYHSITAPKGKQIFQIFDHCSIFLLILGTYIPISLLILGGGLGWTLFGINAGCALVGIILNAVDLARFKKLSMILYAAMGWMVVLTIKPVLEAIPMQGVLLLLLGGLAYTIGIFFYKKREVRYMHFIWHLFVLAGSTLHFFMIYLYCFHM
ncbi:MAG: hemolysin III family protein [Evtepia sp.]